ncbi:hypothetical protein B0A53_00961 [Rhodotorula sp. CCFEE 5036]|nr:hypothetical protein B0A53_00961 [Rhodotorula sp. CCFEE 5036]
MAPERTRRRTQPIRASKIKHHAPPPVATPGSSNPGYVHDTLSGQFVQRRRDTGQLGRDRKTGRFTRKSSTTPPAATRDEATSKEALGAEAGRTANAYLAVTEQFARDLDHTYTILDRFETDRVLLSLATAVVADIAEWVFLMHTLGSRYSPDAILLHGGAVSRRILGRVASDWHARSQLEQARRRIRAWTKCRGFADVERIRGDVQETSFWASLPLAVIARDPKFSALFPADGDKQHCDTLLRALTLVSILTALSYAPTWWGKYQSAPARLEVRESKADWATTAAASSNGSIALGVVFTHSAPVAERSPWDFLFGPMGPGLSPDERDSLELEVDGAAWSIAEHVDDETRRVNLMGAIARTNGLSTAERGTDTEPSHTLCVYEEAGIPVGFMFPNAKRATAIESGTEATLDYGFGGEAARASVINTTGTMS